MALSKSISKADLRTMVENGMEVIASRVRCTWCEAAPGERCTFPIGAYRQWFHNQRYNLAKDLLMGEPARDEFFE